MNARNNWLSAVKTSPLATNVCFGFIQMILEKLVGHEFSCPCHSDYNHLYGLVVFIVPTIIVFLLMCTFSHLPKLCSQKCTVNQWKSFCEVLIVLFVPPTTWLILVLVDGRYFACAMTDWPGKYELIEKADPQKWCKPPNSSLEQERLAQTQLLYSYSEYIGFSTAAVLTGIYVVCCVGSRCCSCPPENTEDTEAFEDL